MGFWACRHPHAYAGLGQNGLIRAVKFSLPAVAWTTNTRIMRSASQGPARLSLRAGRDVRTRCPLVVMSPSVMTLAGRDCPPVPAGPPSRTESAHGKRSRPPWSPCRDPFGHTAITLAGRLGVG